MENKKYLGECIVFGCGPLIQLIGYVSLIISLFKKSLLLQLIGLIILTIGFVIKTVIILFAVAADLGTWR